VLETSQPPAYYLPSADIDLDLLVDSDRQTYCEWKGVARYHDLAVPGTTVVRGAAWSYPAPADKYELLVGHLAFYPQLVDACFVDGERVDPNEGSFYGGWVTSAIVGPFKGGAGTTGW
jgi:uncharacterized protein (DUF427 family)